MKNASHRILFFCMILGLTLTASGQTEKVVFSVPGGFYDTCFSLSLECLSDLHHVRYTTNGTTPDANSRLYEHPLLLNDSLYSQSDIYTILTSPPDAFYLPDSVQHCIVIRAAAFDENDNCVSTVITNSYFIKALGCDTHGLPAISLCADSLDLFDDERGIFVPGIYFDPLNPQWTGNYYQKGMDWERPMNIEFYELDNTGINQQAGLRTHGGNGRRLQQKCMRFYAREKYGKKRFKHRFFETIPNNSFKHLVLKPFVASWNESSVNDHICNQIASQLNLETLASRPVILYLNGEYWGIYYIHERPDARYLEDHFGIDIDNVNIMGNWYDVVDHGSPENFIALCQWMETADLTQPEDYAYLESKIDVDNFIDYQIFELYSENLDWPANNMRCWQLGDGPWRWIFYDGDACFLWMTFNAFDNAVYEGSAIWPSNVSSTLFFRKLLENEDFKARFESRFLELLDTAFDSSVTIPIFEDIKSQIEAEIPFQSNRFGFPQNLETWELNMNRVKYFLNARTYHLFESLNDLLVEIPEHPIESFSCYPNPANGVLFVETRLIASLQDPTYRITNLMGQTLLQGNITAETQQINIEKLPAGMYFITFAGETRKFVVK